MNTEIFHLKVECTLKVELLWARIEHDKSLHNRKSRFFIKTWNCHYYSFNNTAYQSRLTTLLENDLSVFSWKKIPLVVKTVRLKFQSTQCHRYKSNETYIYLAEARRTFRETVNVKQIFSCRYEKPLRYGFTLCQFTWIYIESTIFKKL